MTFKQVPQYDSEEMKKIEVAAAIITDGAKVFATQRGYGEFKDWWEFPGGKLEAGESAAGALRREIFEELGITIEPEELLATVEWDYPDFHLVLHCFMTPLPSGSGITLKEHEAARWLGADELASVRWLPADKQLLPLIAARL